MKRSIRCVPFLITVVLLAGASHTAVAAPQGGASGSLSGVVIGPNDKPVPHAAVTYQSSSGRGPHVIRADARGRFHIAKLSPDNYDVRASFKGVFSEWEKNVTVHSRRDRSLTLRLIYSKQPLSAPAPKH